MGMYQQLTHVADTRKIHDRYLVGSPKVEFPSSQRSIGCLTRVPWGVNKGDLSAKRRWTRRDAAGCGSSLSSASMKTCFVIHMQSSSQIPLKFSCILFYDCAIHSLIQS